MARHDDPAATTIGSKSGEDRTTPLVFRGDGDRHAIIALAEGPERKRLRS